MAGAKPFFRPHLVFSGGKRRGPPMAPDAPPRPGVHPAPDGGYERRFRELILPHLDGAYNFARYLARDPVAAEDSVQEAFLRAFRAFPDYRGEAPKAWLFAIVRNCFLTWAGAGASAGRVVVAEGTLSPSQASAVANAADPDQETPEQALLRRREAETLREVIDNLPEPFRESLVLREFEDLSYKDIAALTGAPIGTVMSRLARARQMLCDMLLPHIHADGALQARESQP